MSKHSKISAVILSVIFLLSMCSFTAFAEDIYPGDGGYSDGGDTGEGGDSGQGDPSGGDIGGGSDVPANPDQGDGDIGGGSDVPVNPDQGSGDVTGGGGYTGDGGYTGGDGDYSGGNSYDDGYSNGGDYSNNNDYIYYDSDGNTYSDYSDMYVGGDQVYTPPATVAPSVPLYDTSNTKIDEKTLSSKDWNDIKARLNGAGKNDASDGDDFAFIQNNLSSGDNGHLIFITGLALVILSLIGFGYLTFSAVARRKTAKAHASGKSSSKGGGHYRSDDYNDGFKAEAKKSAKRGSRYDTAKIPKVSAKSTKSSKGGKRYK